VSQQSGERRSLDQLRLNNEVAGFKFATVGALYAVLLAFAVIMVWEKFSEAENTVAQEAGLWRRCTDWRTGSGASLARRSATA
jgi:hypothetical protein